MRGEDEVGMHDITARGLRLLVIYGLLNASLAAPLPQLHALRQAQQTAALAASATVLTPAGACDEPALTRRCAG